MLSTVSLNKKQMRFFGKLPLLWTQSQSVISVVVTLIFIACSSWLLGQLFWQLQQPSTTIASWEANQSQVTQLSGKKPTDISNLVNANLFGRYSETAPVIVQPIVQDAPKTKLNLVLVGAVATSDKNNSLAIIANRGSQSTYGIGEQIEGTQAKLKAVFIDRVIIDNSGRDETLMLEGIEYSRRALQQDSVTSSQGVGNNQVRLADIRAQVVEDPQSILRYIRLSQVKRNDRLLGYRVRPGNERALFDSVGLQEGDIATQLNGEDLTNPTAMSKIWQSINELTELNLTVDRDGQLHEIYIAF